MYSVTKRIDMIKQPRGGYIRPKELEEISFDDRVELAHNENIHANLVGLAVDYLSRFMTGASIRNAFCSSLCGSERVNERKNAETLLSKIDGLDDKSIINACKLVGYDVCFRSGIIGYRPVAEICPDVDTINNIRIMVNRSLAFWKEYGPIIIDGFTFEGGYTNIVSSGDGDYLTKDTLWDFKVSKESPKNKHTLQLLMYYIMGCHSIHKEFQSINKLGIFNPRLNKAYILDIANISDEVIQEVSSKVIGYK